MRKWVIKNLKVHILLVTVLASTIVILLTLKSFSVYRSFTNERYLMRKHKKGSVVLLTPVFGYSDAEVTSLLDNANKAYSIMETISGKCPPPVAYIGPKHEHIVALVTNTCGAGCGILGRSGIEINVQALKAAHSDLQSHAFTEQVLSPLIFYEIGRNFWFYGHLYVEKHDLFNKSLSTIYAVLVRSVLIKEILGDGAMVGDLKYGSYLEGLETASKASTQDAEPDILLRLLYNGYRDQDGTYVSGIDLLSYILYSLYQNCGREIYMTTFHNYLQQYPKSHVRRASASLQHLLCSAFWAAQDGCSHSFPSKIGCDLFERH